MKVLHIKPIHISVATAPTIDNDKAITKHGHVLRGDLDGGDVLSLVQSLADGFHREAVFVELLLGLKQHK